ncbi:hypothetical protein [Halomarina oriensis]|uniref:Uncharacterized protein n=1 Tax=Halomarina oriensis TaxID=671145 RepID=A0A6B0GGH2_9EURY|nr:hypothetical protein [Halomarina oriensis]MWG33620.1 hypothetical protein [Halomarina oriensis]
MDESLFFAGVVVSLTGVSLFFFGAFGPVVVGLVLLVAGLASSGSSEEQSEREDGPKGNCPSCGARNAAARESCHYCDEPL